jgi:hypothetical protein
MDQGPIENCDATSLSRHFGFRANENGRQLLLLGDAAGFLQAGLDRLDKLTGNAVAAKERREVAGGIQMRQSVQRASRGGMMSGFGMRYREKCLTQTKVALRGLLGDDEHVLVVVP